MSKIIFDHCNHGFSVNAEPLDTQKHRDRALVDNQTSIPGCIKYPIPSLYFPAQLD